MIKMQNIKMFIGLFLIAFAAVNTACSNSSGATTAQKMPVKAVESPTPEYKPPRRVSRDIIKTEKKDDAAVKSKAK